MGISDDMLEAYGRQELDEYTHWVYVLRCSSNFRTFTELERKAEKRLNRKPDWLREAFEAKQLFYVGQTENLEKRLGQHYKQQNSSEFTTLFPPRGIERLIPTFGRSSAEFEEHSQAEAISDSAAKRFAYSN